MDKKAWWSIYRLIKSQEKGKMRRIQTSEIGSRKHLSRTKGPDTKAPIGGRNQKCPCGSGKKYKKCCGVQRKETP